MINIQVESLIALPDVGEYLSSRGVDRPGKAATYRWARLGVKGHRLEVAMIAGRMYTSVEALNRFFAATAGQSLATPPPKSRGMSKAEAKALIP